LKPKKSAVTPVLMEKMNPVFCTSPIPSRDKSRHGDKKIITNPVTPIKNMLYLKKVNHKNPLCVFGGTVSIFASCTGVAKGLLFRFFLSTYKCVSAQAPQGAIYPVYTVKNFNHPIKKFNYIYLLIHCKLQFTM